MTETKLKARAAAAAGSAPPKRVTPTPLAKQWLSPYMKLVFLHLPKTAGTTTHSLMTQAFPPKLVCPTRSDSIHRMKMGEIEPFRYFSGHFTRYSVDCIPAPKRVFTFLRDPRDRIVSLYYFWRAHRPDVIKEKQLGAGPRIATELDLLDFLRSDHPSVINNVDNVMTRSFLGPLRLTQGAPYYLGLDEDAAVEEAARYLDTMYFVGFQHRYESDISELMQRVTGRPWDAQTLARERGFETFAENPDMRPITREPITPEISQELDRLTRLDSQLFAWARERFGA